MPALPEVAGLAGSPDAPRSRYTEEPLADGEMVVTLVVSGNDLFGHAHVAFEWVDPHPGPSEQRHRHEVYHLYPLPTEEERARGLREPDPLTLALTATTPRPGKVDKATQLDFFPRRDKEGRPLEAWFKSWRVPFERGWKARQAAEDALATPPAFQLFRGEGRNCARWAVDMATTAGADAETAVGEWLVSMPREIVKDGSKVPPPPTGL